jgi:SNF2 family DNA or RNA helicase
VTAIVPATRPRGTRAERKPLVKIKDSTEYMQHQADGVRRMAGMTSFLLADEMGLGKSLQSLTVAAVDYELGAAARTIIVAPATLKWNWAGDDDAEVDKFTNFSYDILDGNPKQRAKQIDGYQKVMPDIVVVGYEQVVAHLADLNALRFDIGIWDEAHYIKNPRSKRSQASLDLWVKRAFLLTGSPMLNHADDLWALLHKIDPVEWPNYWAFVSRYCVFGGYKDKQVVGIKNKAELTERLERVMIRRYKKDVLDLPDKQYVRKTVELHPDQKELIDKLVEEWKLDLPDDPNPGEIENALTRTLRQRQICGTPACIPGHADKSFKLDAVVNDTQQIIDSGEKVVIFTQFRGVLAALSSRLEKKGIPFEVLHGDVHSRERVPTVNRWGADPRPNVLIAMLQVSGVGLNMTKARHALFPDRLWAPKLNEQAEDREHRIGAGKSQPIQILIYTCRGTIENRVEQILQRKSKFFRELVDSSAGWKAELIKELKSEGLT